MKNFTLKAIQKLTNGELLNAEGIKNSEIKKVVSDSRKVVEDSLFLCIEGNNFDGHSFAKQAVENGALAVVAEKEIPDFNGPCLLVDSVFEATLVMAEYRRSLLNIPFIGITGSVGKTSTKEFIACVLAQKYKVYKTEKNLNNEWGVPFTILGIGDDAEAAVIEMGISHFGEMEILSKVVRPDVAVITNIGQSHLEFLKNRDGVLKAKAEIFKYMNKQGIIILNGDDNKLSSIESVNDITPCFYGMYKKNQVSISGIKQNSLSSSEFNIEYNDYDSVLSLKINLPVPGIHMIYNAAAAFLVGMKLDVSVPLIKRALESSFALEGRNNIITNRNFTIIDDCYNASPSSMKAAIDILKLSENRKVAILGDMLELGEDSGLYHAEIGDYAVSAGIDVIICVGDNSRQMYLSAKMSSAGQVFHFSDVDECIESLLRIIDIGDTILVKASNAMNFKSIIEYLSV